MLELQVTRAIYKGGALIFADPELAPKDGTEVVITFLKERWPLPASDPILALRGRGKGEKLVEKLLRSRKEDKEHNGSNPARLCT